MRALALIVAMAVFPGVAEAAEDAAHLFAEGHTLHEQPVAHEHEGGEQHKDGEHGCSVLFHLCGCHSPTPLMIVTRLSVARSDDMLAATPGRIAAQKTKRPPDRVHGETFRPPIA